MKPNTDQMRALGALCRRYPQKDFEGESAKRDARSLIHRARVHGSSPIDADKSDISGHSGVTVGQHLRPLSCGWPSSAMAMRPGGLRHADRRRSRSMRYRCGWSPRRCLRWWRKSAACAVRLDNDDCRRQRHLGRGVCRTISGIAEASKGAYRASLVLFALGSAACAAAPDMAVFLAGRLLQGWGGGLLVALAYTTIQRVFPEGLRTRAMVLVPGPWGIAAPLRTALRRGIRRMGTSGDGRSGSTFRSRRWCGCWPNARCRDPPERMAPASWRKRGRPRVGSFSSVGRCLRWRSAVCRGARYQAALASSSASRSW